MFEINQFQVCNYSLYFNYYRRLFELQNDSIIPGVRKCNRVQFPSIRIASWNIPHQLTKCYWSENGKFNA